MQSMAKIGSIISAAMLFTLSGCANTYNTPAANYGTSSSTNLVSGYGIVQSVEMLQPENAGIGGSGIGVGAIAGAVVGGIVGNQVGAGRGKTVATIAGVAGGAYVGNEIEKRNQQNHITYKVSIRMNSGAYQTIIQDTNTGLRVGDRVRINNGVVQRY